MHGRKHFIQTIIAGTIGMTTSAAFKSFTSGLSEQEQIRPVLFIGHGSPMNGIEDTEFSRRWTKMANEIPTPKAVLVVSAHWFTRGTRITAINGPQYHYDLAKQLCSLRKKGVLIIGSGNMVHNLRMVAWDKLNEQDYGYDSAKNINEKFKSLIQEENHQSLINYSTLGKEALLAIPTPEHYLPLMYALGAKGNKDDISFFNDKAVGGSLTMTSVKIG